MSELCIEIPKMAENLSLPDPCLVNFYKELERRTIWIDGEIDDSALEIERYILRFNHEDAGVPVDERKPIKLLFFTPGGDLDVNNSLIALIRMSKTPVWGINMGSAASAGAFVFLACHKRLALPWGVFLLHQGSASGMSGTHEQVVQITAEYKRQINRIVEFVVERTNIPRLTASKNMKKEWYIPAEDAVELGICDSIVDSIDELL